MNVSEILVHLKCHKGDPAYKTLQNSGQVPAHLAQDCRIAISGKKNADPWNHLSTYRCTLYNRQKFTIKSGLPSLCSLGRLNENDKNVWFSCFRDDVTRKSISPSARPELL